MIEMPANIKKNAQSGRILRLLVGVLLVASLFGGGVFLSRAFDQHVLVLVSELRAFIKKKYGITSSIGQVEVGFGALRLSEVSIGEPGWLAIDRVDVSISFNPFKNFLRPHSMSIGQATVKVPWRPELWPRELKLIYDAVKRGTAAEKVEYDVGKTSAIRNLLPSELTVDAARVEVADGEITKFLSEKLKARLDMIWKDISFKAHRVRALELIDESFVEGDLKLVDRQFISASILGRLSADSGPIWSGSCESRHDLTSLSCQIDSKHLPVSLVRPLQRFVGTGFAPGFQGSITVEPLTPDDASSARKINIEGTLGNIIIEHPTLSIGAVGPISLSMKLESEVDYTQKAIKIFPSQFQVSSLETSQSESTGDRLPINLNGEIRVENLAPENQYRPSGFLNVDVPTTDCQVLVNSVPKSFVSELAGISLGGTTNLDLTATLVNGLPEIKIKKSSFNCDTLSGPEIYSANYLNGPFNIERSLPDGKIYIPVDPARPYFSSYKDIPSLVRSAFVSSEDAGFFQHKGVELSAIIGAVERNTEEGRAAVGGSTITMQTVKNLFLARDKTISRKVQEIFLAWHLERTISKERILEIYLNMVEFGPGLYGIGMASQRFFGKSPKELSLKQAIYLASLLPAPVPRYRYFCKGEITVNYDRILRQLLDRMLGLGRITSAQHADAIGEKIEFSQIERQSACGPNHYADSEATSDF